MGERGGEGLSSGKKGFGGEWVACGAHLTTSHWFCAFSTLPPPSLAVGCLDLPPRPVAVATYPRQHVDGAVDVDRVPTARAGGGKVF